MMLSRIKTSTIFKSVVYAFSIMPSHFINMAMVALFISAIPVAGIVLSRNVFAYAELAVLGETAAGSFVLLLILYTLYLGLIKFYSVYYKRVSVQFSSMPLFEKRIKANFHKKAEELPLKNYENPRFYNSIWEAKVASINLYRIMECVIDFFAITASIVAVGAFLSSFHVMFWLFIALSAVPSYLENIVEAKIRTRRFKAISALNKTEQMWYKCLTEPRYFKEIKSYQSHHFLAGKWAFACTDFLEEEYRAERSIFIAKTVSNVLKTSSVIGIYAISAWLFFLGLIGFGEFVASLGAALFLSSQYSSLFEASGYFSKFIHMVKPFFAFMETPSKLRDEVEFMRLELRNLSFEYPTSTEAVLSNIDMKIQRGEKIAIIGINGMGKSTLSKIIAGHLPPSSGELILNGVPHDSKDHEYSLLGVTATYQDFCRYELSVAENVAISNIRDGIDERRVATVLEAVGLDVEQLSLGGHLGKEFGTTELSGGQWQRLAIARSLYNDSSTFFVFDEATSAIDPLEEKNLNEIFVGSANETVIIISHRLSIARLVDRIIVLDHGKIVEQGTHNQLVAQNGYYAKMWNVQVDWYR